MKTGYSKYLILFCYLVLVSLFPTNQIFAKQFSLPDSVKSEFYKEKNPEKRLTLVLAKATNELNTGLSNAIALYGVSLADSLKDKRKLAEAYEVLGVSFNKKGDYSSAIENLGLSLQIYEQIGSRADVAKLKRTMGETFRATKNYLLAMEYLNQSLDYFSKNPDDVLLARIHNRIAATLYEMWYIGNDKIFGKLTNTGPTITFKAKVALEPDLKIKDDSLVNALQTSKYHAEKAGRYDLIISSNIIEGSYLVSTSQYQEAINLFEETVKVIETHDLYEDLPLIYLNWARVYSIGYLDQPERAIELSKKALEISKKQEIPAYIFMANNTIHANYAFMGDYENAYMYLMEQVPAIQEYGEKDLIAQLKTLEYQFELQENERELKSNKIQLQIILIGIAIIMLFGGLFIYFLYRVNKKQKELLSVLSKKNIIISKQNEELEQTNAEKDRFFAILAHDLKGPVKAVSTSLELITDDLKNGNSEGALAMAKAISSSAQRASDLLQNLIQWAKSQRGKIQIQPQILVVNNLVLTNLELLDDNIQSKQICITNLVNPDLMIYSDKDILDTVIRNILSNAVKFSNRNNEIIIDAKVSNEQMLISVKDEGIGMDQEMVENIFKIDAYNSRPGTAGEVSSGLGLILCKDFLAYINGTIEIISEENKGTEVIITIPMKS